MKSGKFLYFLFLHVDLIALLVIFFALGLVGLLFILL